MGAVRPLFIQEDSMTKPIKILLIAVLLGVGYYYFSGDTTPQPTVEKVSK